MLFAPSKSRKRAKVWIMGVSKTSDHIWIKIKMPNPSQEPPASSKAPNEDLKDMDVLCTFKTKIESQNSEYGYTKVQWPYPNQYQDPKPKSGTTSILQSPKSELKDMDVLCTFKIMIKNCNSDQGCIKEYPCPLSPDLGLWRMQEDPDWCLASWSWFGYCH